MRYEDEIVLEEILEKPQPSEFTRQGEFKTEEAGDKMVKRSKSELYQGEKCVFDMFREAQSYKYFQEMLSQYDKTTLGSTDLFKSLDEEDGRGRMNSSMDSTYKKGGVKVNLKGVVGTETARKRQEDEVCMLWLMFSY